MPLLGFFMVRVLTAAPAELAKLQTICGRLLVLGCDVVAALAIVALQHNVIARHNLFPISDCQFPIDVCGQFLVFPIGNRQLEIGDASTPAHH